MGYLSIPRPKDIENELTQLVKESRTGRTLDEGGNFQQRDWLLSKQLSDGVTGNTVDQPIYSTRFPGKPTKR